MTPATTPAKVVARLGDLPTLPGIYARIAELTADPDTGAKDLEEVIENDQSLATKLLKLVNSAFFGFPVEISTIGRAVMIVGFKALSQLAMSASVLNLFPEGDEESLDYRAFWAHSIGAAVLARHISIEQRKGAPEEMFLAGLVHDLGVLILSRQLPDDYPEVLRLARDRDLFLYEAEREVLGFDHSAAGHALATSWGLPKTLAEAVSSHHHPSIPGPLTECTAVVHVSCALASAAGVGLEGVDLVPPLDSAAWDLLCLSPARIPDLLRGVDEEIRLFMEMMDR